MCDKQASLILNILLLFAFLLCPLSVPAVLSLSCCSKWSCFPEQNKAGNILSLKTALHFIQVFDDHRALYLTLSSPQQPTSFFVPWRTRFICIWIVPIVLPTASDAGCGLSRILSAIVIFFSEVCLKLISCCLLQTQVTRGKGRKFCSLNKCCPSSLHHPILGLSMRICNNACPRSSPWSTSHY